MALLWVVLFPRVYTLVKAATPGVDPAHVQYACVLSKVQTYSTGISCESCGVLPAVRDGV
jgi:hypothetical protein